MSADTTVTLAQRRPARWLFGLFLAGVLQNLFLLASAQAQTAGPGCNEASTTAFPAVSGELVQLVSCTEEREQGGNNSLTIDVPTGVVAGDFLVFVLSTDGDNEDINSPANFSADWSLAGTYLPSPEITSEVYTRVADGTEPGSYTFNWGTGEQYYSYMLRFTNASGQFSIASDTGTSNSAATPTLSTNSAENLILKMVNIDQRDFASFNDTADVTGMTTPYYNIVENSSRPPSEGGGGGATTSGAALYYYQSAQGAGAAGTFNLSDNEEWHTRTMGIEPIEFRISMTDTLATVCSFQEVTVSVTDRLGNPMTWFTGTINLSASNAAGAGWSDAGALNGTLNDTGNGNASYQFSAADNGVATFRFDNSNTGVTNFDIAYNGISNIENSSFDPNLTITECAPQVLAQSCVAGTSTSITIGAQEPVAADRGRMVVLAVSMEGDGDFSAATFDTGGTPQSMYQIFDERIEAGAFDNNTELWAIKESSSFGEGQLPVAGGTYTASITSTDPDPALCLFYLEDTRQVYPSGTDINGSQASNTQVASTSITTTLDQSFILSVVGAGSDGDYSAVSPTPPMSRLFNGPDPGSATFAGSSGLLANAGSITVEETFGGGAPNRHTHIVAAFGPVNAGVTPTEIRLAHSGQSSVCEVEAVTISITDSSGTLAANFTGTITITNSASAGTWTVNTATNSLVDNGNGSVDYTFAPADNGQIILNYGLGFADPVVDFQVTTTTPGIASPSGANDPTLAVSSTCPPIVSPASCVAGTSTSISIDPQNSNPAARGRMVLMAISFEQPNDVSAATFDVGGLNAPMTQIFEEVNLNGIANTTELWGILDTDLPTAGGTYTGSFTTTDADPSMCLIFVDNLNQNFPVPDSVTPSNGPVNGSQAQNQQDAVTTITTSADDSLILSLVGNGSGGSDYSSVSPNPPMSRYFDAPDPGGGAEFEGSSGILATAGAITVTETWGGGSPNRHSHVVASFPPLVVTPVVPEEIRISHSTESDVCSVEAITISITNSSGAVATGFTGTITITNSAAAGTWTVNDADNALVDNGSGSVDYTFAPSDSGEIVLDYQLFSTDSAVDFNVTSTTPGISPPSGSFDPTLDVTSCTAEVDINATTNLCSVSETLSLTIRDRDGGVPSGTIGTVVLNNTTANGNYVSTTGAGTLNNGTVDDGLATYEFAAGDNGTATFEFSADSLDTLAFSASSTYITFDSAASNENLQIFSCEFRISHSGNSDVCSVETVTISVFNSNNAAVTDYVGTVNLSTDSGNGTWTVGTGNGTLTDPVSGDGSATYTFVPGDNGSVDLGYTNLNEEVVNLNASDGVTTDSNASFDPNLDIASCTFRIALDDGTTTACSVEQVTITVYDSGGAIATGFTGTVSISTDSVSGNWADAGGLNGTLTETTPDDGIATYTFVGADNGAAVFNFSDTDAGDVNINLQAGDISEDGSFDPTLEVTGCVPTIANTACFPGTGPGTGNLTINAADPGRMVVMIIWHIDASPQDVTNATFNGANMTQIKEIAGGNTAIEMWGMLDTDLPAGAGSYAGAYTFDAATANNPSMCMVELSDVAQQFPAEDLTTPTAGQVNANTFTPDGAPLDLTTTITTSANNALVLTAALSDFTQTPNTWFNSVEPNPPIDLLFSGTNDQNPESGTAGGSEGVASAAGLITVTDTDNQDATTNASHIVASFNPRVAGDPQAEGFVPVTLFDTLSGNLSYRAIGNTLRTDSNGDGGQCSFVPVGTGSDATLSMPTGSTVRKAYLYWAGSGATVDIDDTVTFGPTGSEISITADDVFQIIGAGGAGSDFFAGYKDVTSQITGNGSYTLSDLVVQTGFPWSATSACAGGWSLVVVYDNANERFRVANVFHGFQPFQNSAFTLVPRNFRMATTDNPGDTPGAGFLPNGDITHITIEGDETLASGDESLGIQVSPGVDSFTTLANSFNPPTADFNSTVTRPIFSNTFGTGFFEFDSTAGLNGDGYEIDQAGPDAVEAGRTGDEIGASWGFDVDTHYIAGNDSSGVLWNFAQPGQEAERITTRYSSGQDLVLLISEIITVTNFALADLEVFKTQSGDFKVNGSGQYQFEVRNNGNNGLTGGEATGEILVADILPTGLTLDSVSGTDWDCSLTTGNAFTCAYDIATDCGVADGCSTAGQLGPSESLPLITANVSVAGTGTFPVLTTNVKNVVRMQHNGGNCGTLTAGVIPDPDTCDRSPQFDNVNDLDGGATDINDLDDKASDNNNVHSIITEVRGVETDLSIEKELNGILEVGETASYTLTVTNLGPDATSGGTGGTITVTDTVPAGITFDSASGTGWSCSLGPLNCTFAGSLALGASTEITLNVTVTGNAGQNVTNTAAVAAGNFNFDGNTSNNSDTDISTIVAPPLSSNERFLLSVSVPGNATTIGGLGPFQNDDYFVYNPLTDVATLFYDDSGLGYGVNDADAVHLFKNGHIAVSAASTSTIGSNSLAFEPEDIVVWDPIAETATVLFDGSAVFDGPITSDENIDAVYVKENGRIVFSTEGPASITFAGPTTLNFNQGDIVEYNPADGSATILVDSSDAEIFGGEVQVDGLYIRVDDSDADANKDVFVLSVDESTATIGACGSCDPVAGTALSRDDVVELDLTGANPVTENLFLGNQPLGVFTPSDSNRTIDAIHTVEDGYLGHFAIAQSQAGSTCEAGQITITKHKGLTHSIDTDYEGSIRISTDNNQGDWAIAVGNGTLDNGTADDGAALYTFAASDNGQVTLFLTEETPSTINVNVTNGITTELGSEDSNFTFNDVITSVTYRDEWSSVSFANNDGTTFWANNWQENDNEGTGPASGNIFVNSGELEFTSTPANPTPSISRTADLSLFSVTETVLLNFDYRYQFLNSGSDVLLVEARPSDSDSFTTVQSFSGIGGTNLTPQSLSLNLTSLLSSPTWTDTTEIRFRIAGGYTGTSRFLVDNIELATGTTDCGIGNINHYEIRIDGVTGPASTIVDGIQCVGSVITVTGHDSGDFPAASNEAITLRTSTNQGDWTLVTGLGTFDNGTLGDGIATYNFPPGEQAATFLFNYTDPTTDPELVNFNITTVYGVKANEDPTLSVQQAGLLFYNETANNPTSVSPLPTQIAGKASNVAPDISLLTIEAVRSSDNDPLACSPIFDAGNTLSIGFAGECTDPGSCSSSLNDQLSINGTTMTPVDSGNVSTYEPIDILMVDQGAGRVGGELVLNFADAGEIVLHAQYELTLNNDINGTATGDFISGNSAAIAYRPFGFDIDFNDDRGSSALAGTSYAADADGTVFATAGVAFNTTVSAIGWQSADDANSDGVPDDGAALYDNAVTPNYGNESTAANYDVRISLDQVVAPNNGVGTLSDTLFLSFTDGMQTKTMVFDEVGIIDLSAQLVESADGTTPDGFLNTGVNLVGNVRNVGRFIPNDFLLSGGVISSRPLANAQSKSIAASNFTYMGEEFGISAMIQARNGNASPAVTRNYVGAFAKLDAADFTVDKFFAVDETGAPDDYSSRLAAASSGLTVSWNTDPTTDGGEATLSGNLVFERQASDAPDGPLDTITIAVDTQDSDSVPFVRDLDVDGGGNDAATIGTEEFRYGRLLIDNAFGPETEPLGIGFTIQYWDGSEFVVNTDDSSTTIFYDASEDVSANRVLDYVDGTFTDNLVEDTDDTVDPGETFVELDAIVADTDVVVSIFEGRTLLRSNVDDDSDGLLDDAPLFTSAPGENNDGSALIEFDLDDSSLPFSLDFLSYDWRGTGETEDVNPDGNYDDNPRGTVQFGSFRGHDRVINWQEIYIAPD